MSKLDNYIMSFHKGDVWPTPLPLKYNPGLGKSKLEWADTTGVNEGVSAHAPTTALHPRSPFSHGRFPS